MELVVKQFDELGTRELYSILKLRIDVFVVEQECFYPDLDGLDMEAIHVYLADDDGSIAAYLRVLKKHDEEGVARIGRVIAAKRGSGIGRELVEAAIQVAVGRFDAREIYVESQVQAQGFYEKLGFVACSDVFDDAGIPHVAMRKKL